MAGNTFTWFGGSGSGDLGSNWTPSGGPPKSGDTAIVNAGTVMITDGSLTDNVLELNAGTFALTNTEASFFSGGSTIVSGFDNATTLLGGTSGEAALDVFGDFVNEGTIEAVANTLTMAVSAYVTLGVSSPGTLLNEGLIAVQGGATLDVTGSSGDVFQGGTVDLKDASALITATDDGSDYTLDNTSTLGLDSASSGDSVNFSGTADMLRLYSTALDRTISIDGFASGDTLDIGAETIGTIVYQGMQATGSSAPFLTILSNTGGTILSDPLTNPNGQNVGNTSGTFVPSTLPDGIVAAGPFEIATAGNGDKLLELLPPSTWQWTNSDPTNFQDPRNFVLVAGPGNQSDTIVTAGTVNGVPTSGDTAFFNNATIAFPLDNTVNGNTIFLTGTSEMSFLGSQTGVANGKAGISYDRPTVDYASIISNDPLPPSTTTLNYAGYNVNEGTLISNGGPGSSLTINVTQNGTAPGYFLNYGEIEAAPHNTVTIAVAGTSELFNANLIYANGGTVEIFASPSGIAGGYAPMQGGVALIGDGGTLVLDTGYPSGVEGSNPVFAFYDGDFGDTLKLDQVGQFGGRILGFQQGDTIDLGEALNVGSIGVTTDGRVLLENPGGTVLASLVLSSGAYNPGTFAVTSPAAGTLVADGFTLTTGTDGNALLTTDVVNSVWNDTSGTWQTAAGWTGSVVPGATRTAIIGDNTTTSADGTITPFVLTTGAAVVTVNSLSEVNTSATLQITSATTVGTSIGLYGVNQIAGEIEITGGNTLSSTFLKQGIPGADLEVDSGAVLAISGHSNLKFANDGTLSEFTVVNGTTFANGNTIGVLIAGTATVDGGMINAGPVLNGTIVESSGGLITVGQDGGGTPAVMTVENGGTVVDTYGLLSSDPTSFGVLTLTGSGTTWDDASDPTDTYNTRGYMLVGEDNQADNQPSPSPSGTAQLVVENDATLNEATYGEIGTTVDSAGSATIASGGVWNIGTSSAGGFLNVGDYGSGTLDIDGGTVNVLAGSSTAAGGFGAAGTITSNGTLSTGDAGMSIAHHTGSTGTLTVSNDGELKITIFPTISTSGFGIGQYGQGELELYDGGTLSISGGGISVGSDTAAANGTLVIGGTINPSGTVVSSGGPNSVLIIAGTTLTGGMSVGKIGSGTLYVESGGTLQMDDGGFNVGNSAGSHGTVQINGGLVENTTNGMDVGNLGTGSVDLNSGTISLDGGITVGNTATAVGFVDVASGLLKTSAGTLDVGNAGTGTFDLSGGTVSVTGAIDIGNSAGGLGTALVTGGALISSGGVLNVGNAGKGTLSIDGGTVSVGGNIQLGLVGGSTGFATIASGRLAGSGLTVGTFGTAAVDVGVGGTVALAGGGVTLGTTANGSGTVQVSGTGALLSTSGAVTVGSTGSGVLSIDAGGVFNAGTGFVSVGNQGGTGTATVSGTLVGGGLQVGGLGVGTLTVASGGQVGISGGTFSGLGIGSAAGGTANGAVFINGGTVSETGNGVSVGGANESGFLQINSSGELITTGTVSGPFSPIAGQINASGTGNAAVDVSGGTWIANGAISVAVSGSGALNINGGGLVNAGTNSVSVGNTIGSAGTLTVGVGTLLAGSLTVADPFAPGAVPGSGILTIATGGTVVTGSLSAATGGIATVRGSLDVTGGNGIAVGQFGVGPSSLTINSGGTVTDAGFFTVGNTGAGAMVVQSGGVFDETGGASVVAGLFGGGSGDITVDGGVFNAGSGSFTLGSQANATGDLTVESGGSLSSDGITIGNNGGSGALTETGAGSRITMLGGVSVGGFSGGSGDLLVENGATAVTGSTTTAVGLDVGQQSGSSGAVTVSGAGARLGNTGEMIVGDGGLGSLAIEAGATVTTAPSSIVSPDAAVIGSQSGASGSEVSVSGSHSDWQVGGTLVVGDAGAGALNIAAGGTVSAAALDSGVVANSDAAISVTGTASALTLTGQLTIGDSSSADLLISSGATVTAENGDIGVHAGPNTITPGGAGAVDIEGIGSRLYIANNLNVGDAGTGVLVMGVGTTLSVENNFNVGVNGVFQQFGGVLDPATFTNKGSVTGGNGAVVNIGSTLVNDGVYAATPGDYTLNIGTLNAGTLSGGTIAGTGSLVIGNAGDLIINAGTVVDTQSVDFNNSGTTGTLTIGTLVGFGGVIDSFNTGAEIILAGTSIVSETFVDNTVTLFGTGGAELGTLAFGANAVTGGYLTTRDGALVEVACFAEGTRIATDRGEVAVEALRVGDMVRTVLGGSVEPIIWIGRREVDCARHAKPRKVWPVRVAAGAFGPGRPHADLFLSPDHAVYVEDVLIPISYLINGSTITQMPVERVTYYHLELAEHDVLLAEGLPAESYLDMRDGSNYANRPGPVRLIPDYAARMWEAFGCARLVVTGPELAAARALVEGFTARQAVA